MRSNVLKERVHVDTVCGAGTTKCMHAQMRYYPVGKSSTLYTASSAQSVAVDTLARLLPIAGGSQGSGVVAARALGKLIKGTLASCRC